VDKISIGGVLMGIIAIVGGQVLEGGSVASLAQPTALLIVLGGTLGAVMLQYSMPVFRRGMQMAKWAWVPPVIDNKRMIDQIIRWSQVSRKEGLLSLENFVRAQKDPFVKRALQLVVDGTDPERLREVLLLEVDVFEDEMRLGARVWESAGGYSPTIGILGAVMGLIHVMENLSDPARLGGGIAVAFVATVYGVAAANLLAARHPYTRGLLNCLPRIGGPRAPLPGLDRTGDWARDLTG